MPMSDYKLTAAKGGYVNTSKAIEGTPCNGCKHLEVVIERRHAREREKYYCKTRFHGFCDPHAISECDLALYEGETEIESVKFNRWYG